MARLKCATLTRESNECCTHSSIQTLHFNHCTSVLHLSHSAKVRTSHAIITLVEKVAKALDSWQNGSWSLLRYT